MGNFWTKILDEIMVGPNHEPNPTSKTSSHPATPIPTARRLILEADPRSPNVDCVRTPIVVEYTQNITPKGPISTSENPLSYLETDFENEPITKVRFVPQDPRSPTLGISRTPIQIVSTPEQANALKCVLQEKKLEFEDPVKPSTEILDNETPVKKIENENISTPSEKIKLRPKIVKTFHNKFNINDNKENPLEILKKKRNENRDENGQCGVTSSPRTPLGTMQPGAILRIKQMRDIKAAVGSSDSITGWDRDASVLI